MTTLEREVQLLVELWLACFDPPPQINFQQSECLQQLIITREVMARDKARREGEEAMRERAAQVAYNAAVAYLEMAVRIFEMDIEDTGSGYSKTARVCENITADILALKPDAQLPPKEESDDNTSN